MRKGQSDSIGMKGVGSAAESTLRAVLCWHAQQVQRQGLSPGTSGNLSVRCGLDMLITPSGVPFERLPPLALKPRADLGELHYLRTHGSHRVPG